MPFNFYNQANTNLCIISTECSVFIYIFSLTSKIWVFLYAICVSAYSLFISTWRKSFNTSCKSGLVVMFPLRFCLSLKILISPSFLKYSFAGYNILGWQFFFIQYFEYITPPPSSLQGSSWEIGT